MSTASFHKRANDACPVCSKPASDAQRPFCSQGCRDRDLLNWLGDAYRVAGPTADETSEEAGPDGLDSERQPPL